MLWKKISACLKLMKIISNVECRTPNVEVGKWKYENLQEENIECRTPNVEVGKWEHENLLEENIECRTPNAECRRGEMETRKFAGRKYRMSKF